MSKFMFARMLLNADAALVAGGAAPVSGNEVEGAIRIPGSAGGKKPVKLRKDGKPRKARVVTDSGKFLAAYKEVLEAGGSIQDLADKIGAEYGSVIQRRESINQELAEAGLPALPDLVRKSGPRKDKKALLALVAATFAPVGKGTLESLPVDAPIVKGPPAMTVEAETVADETVADSTNEVTA
jgi:hypothetical protein